MGQVIVGETVALHETKFLSGTRQVFFRFTGSNIFGGIVQRMEQGGSIDTRIHTFIGTDGGG